jgi:PAS domain S-box-containing protein
MENEMNSNQTDSKPLHRGWLDALEGAVILVDPTNLVIIDCNSEALALTGLSFHGKSYKPARIDIIYSSLGRIDGLESMLNEGAGSLNILGKGAILPGPLSIDVRSFMDGNIMTSMMVIRKGHDNTQAVLELDQLRREQCAMMEMTTDLVFTLDRSGKIMKVNRVIRGLGYREEEVIGESISSFIGTSFKEPASNLLETLFSGATAEQAITFEVFAKDGEPHLLKVRGWVVVEEGLPTEVQCIARDITPLEEADKALGESLWQYKSLFEHAHVAMWEIDVIDALTLARDIERNTGISIQEAIVRDPTTMIRFMDKMHYIDVNRECLDLFHANSKEELYAGHGRIFPEKALLALSGWVGSMLVGNSGASLEFMIKTLDGEDRSVVLRWGSLQSHSSGQRRILLSFIDTSDKMRTFWQMESEKHFADAIIDFAESLIIGMDLDGTITIFNRKAEQSTGIRRDEVLGRNYFALFDKEVDQDGGRAWLQDLAKGKGSVERIKVLPGRSASPLIWWHNTVVDSGDHLVMISLGVDITERVSLNQRMEELNDSLLLLNRIMRHDIMNDLSVALGSIQLYVKKREGRFLDAATRSLTKSVDLINDISDLERLRTPTELRSVKVREVIDRVVANRAGQNVLIRVNGEATAMVDETFSSVIDNLVGNAIMHGHTETVDIDIGIKDGQCLISVADMGKGIPEAIKSRIFDEGFKFGETANTGFGLYIVKKTMERYGGSVIVRDNHPCGTVFELRLLLQLS